MQRRIVISLLGVIASPTFACTVGPAVAEYTKADLVAKTKTIVLVESLGSKMVAAGTEFGFRTVQTLRGKDPGTFKLALQTAPARYLETDFSAHSDPEFWAGTYGRLPWSPGSCTPTYAFETGGQYLLFLESLGNGAAAERIRSRNNRWYRYVRSRVKIAA